MQKTREIVLSTPAGKRNFQRTPGEMPCLDRAQTSTTSCPDGFPVSTSLLSVWSKSAHTRRFDRKRKIYTYTYHAFCLFVCLPLSSHLVRDFVISLCYVFRTVPLLLRAIPNEKKKKITTRDLFVVNRVFFSSQFRTEDHESRHEFSQLFPKK